MEELHISTILADTTISTVMPVGVHWSTVLGAYWKHLIALGYNLPAFDAVSESIQEIVDQAQFGES